MNPGRGGDGKTRFIFIRKPDENPQAFPFVFPPILPCFYARGGGGAVAELPPPRLKVCVCVCVPLRFWGDLVLFLAV